MAHVDVTAPQAPPAEPHVGDALFFENFDHAALQTFSTNGAVTSATIDLVSEGGGVGAVAHEPAGLDESTHGIDRGKRMARRERVEFERRPTKNPSGGTKRESGRSRASVASAASISLLVLAS
jgi:hypothetical protein